ncbi:hypothetical protein DJ93_5640 [Bacillus clarus]|uniref:Uncharacterized protein n=1 Tax=Bacillus clarus TaxID=2338372 RepID=A0A090Y9T9_9BACI|nr:hypothetical protein DJ93_5640 [Bacillus clarus]
MNLGKFNNSMSLHVSYNDVVDMRLTRFTNFYVLYVQLCEVTTELIKEKRNYNMTLTESPLSIDIKNRKNC